MIFIGLSHKRENPLEHVQVLGVSTFLVVFVFDARADVNVSDVNDMPYAPGAWQWKMPCHVCFKKDAFFAYMVLRPKN